MDELVVKEAAAAGREGRGWLERLRVSVAHYWEGEQSERSTKRQRARVRRGAAESRENSSSTKRLKARLPDDANR